MDNSSLAHELRAEIEKKTVATEEPPKKKLKTVSKGRWKFCHRNKDLKTTVTCNLCINFVCKEHIISVCRNCIQENKM